MAFEKADVTRYMYTAGVLVSGIYLNHWLSGFDIGVVVALGLLVAVVWFLYYKLILVEKIELITMRAGSRDESRGTRDE